MHRFLPFVSLLALASCSGDGGSDSTTGTAGPSPSQVCDRIVEAYDTCVTGTTTTTGTTGPSCEEQLAPCLDTDLALYLAYADCVEVECDYLGCFVELEALSAECLSGTGS